jgi:hypothetical protein
LATHKFGRLALPFFLLAMLLSSLSLTSRHGYRMLAALQLGGYSVGGLAAVGIAPPPPFRAPARAAGQFVLGNFASARGVIRAVRGRQDVRWQPVR